MIFVLGASARRSQPEPARPVRALKPDRPVEPPMMLPFTDDHVGLAMDADGEVEPMSEVRLNDAIEPMGTHESPPRQNGQERKIPSCWIGLSPDSRRLANK